MSRTFLFFAAAAASLALAPAAIADTLVAPAPDGRNLAAGGGYLVWSAPTGEGRFKLVLRTPEGTVVEPAIPSFGTPPDPTIGSVYAGNLGQKRLVIGYSRCEGASATADCDVHAYDPASQAEERVRGLSTRTYSETAPSLYQGTWTFVRRGAGKRKGVHAYTSRSGRLRRVTATLARETATNGSRVAYTYNSSRGGGVAIRRISNEGSVVIAASRLDVVPHSLGVTRYNAAWLVGETAYSTTRFGGSGGPHDPMTRAGRSLPGVDSIAIGATISRAWFLDADGVKSPNPPIFST